MSECECTMRTKLVGDGCEICNPQLAIDLLKEQVAALESKLAEAEKDLAACVGFYGNPETYFAIGIFPDNPCGQFIEDYSLTDLGMKPGKIARAIGKRWPDLVVHDEVIDAAMKDKP